MFASVEEPRKAWRRTLSSIESLHHKIKFFPASLWSLSWEINDLGDSAGLARLGLELQVWCWCTAVHVMWVHWSPSGHLLHAAAFSASHTWDRGAKRRWCYRTGAWVVPLPAWLFGKNAQRWRVACWHKSNFSISLARQEGKKTTLHFVSSCLCALLF